MGKRKEVTNIDVNSQEPSSFNYEVHRNDFGVAPTDPAPSHTEPWIALVARHISLLSITRTGYIIGPLVLAERGRHREERRWV